MHIALKESDKAPRGGTSMVRKHFEDPEAPHPPPRGLPQKASDALRDSQLKDLGLPAMRNAARGIPFSSVTVPKPPVGLVGAKKTPLAQCPFSGTSHDATDSVTVAAMAPMQQRMLDLLAEVQGGFSEPLEELVKKPLETAGSSRSRPPADGGEGLNSSLGRALRLGRENVKAKEYQRLVKRLVGDPSDPSGASKTSRNFRRRTGGPPRTQRPVEVVKVQSRPEAMSPRSTTSVEEEVAEIGSPIVVHRHYHHHYHHHYAVSELEEMGHLVGEDAGRRFWNGNMKKNGCEFVGRRLAPFAMSQRRLLQESGIENAAPVASGDFGDGRPKSAWHCFCAALLQWLMPQPGGEIVEQNRAASPVPSVHPSEAASNVSGPGGQPQALGPQQQGLANVLQTSGLRVQPQITALSTRQVQDGFPRCDPDVQMEVEQILRQLPARSEDNVGWEDWPLPSTENDEMPDISLYARDAIFFAKKFVQLTGHGQRGPRSLPASAQASQQRSLEDRTVQGLFYKKMPVVLQFQRHADAQWQPFELHLARCTKWPAGVQFGLETGRTTMEPRRAWADVPGGREARQGGRGGGTPRSQQAEEPVGEAPADDPWQADV
eukprot:s259_g26.t1